MQDKINKLTDLLLSYQRAYYTTGRAMVSDAEYDRLYDNLVELEKAYPQYKRPDSPTLRVGSDLSSDFAQVQHTIPVLSLDKAYSDQEVYSFIEKTRRQAGDSLSFVLEEKIDGFSIVLYYRDGVLEKAVTRGNGSVGNDVTANVRTIHAVPLKLSRPVTIAVRGEIYLPKADFDRINRSMEEPYANPRNLAAGTIRRIKSSDTAKVPLSIFCYEGFQDNTAFTDHIQILKDLKDLGFRTDPAISLFCSTREEARLRLESAGLEGKALCFDDIPKDIQERTATRRSLGYEIDGLVMKVNELSTREELGYTEHHPRWAVAYKFDPPLASSTVLDIDVQVGRTGRVTPMARIKPTELSGSVISNVTLHNQDYVDSLEIAVGDTVEISKRGDVIPAVERVIDKNEDDNTTFVMPDTCPVCGAPVEKRGAHHFCISKDCPAQQKGRLEFFCAKKQMDIEGLGPRTLQIAYDNGYIRTIEDLYRFDWKNLIRDKVDGFGEKKVSAIEQSLKDSLDRPLERKIVALGIEDLGQKSVDLIASNIDFEKFDDLIAMAQSDSDSFTQRLSQISGIGPITARSITQGLCDPQVQGTVRELESLGLDFSKSHSDAFQTAVLPQIFAGQTWCVTGTFEHFVPRDKAMDIIKSLGGKETSSVSKKTTCLLAGANAGSKLAKAQSLGVRIVTETEFLAITNAENINKETDNTKDKDKSKENEEEEVQGLLWT